ncbi:MAG: CBS domain-containing protein [Succinivibrionaceae bacterium]|nr:CBS domain-containing protein [Succinivibrionaceae bacterium]
MSDNHSSPEKEENLFDRITGLFQSEPQSIDELNDVIKEASNRKIINGDSLDMIQGILEMTDLRVRDIMVPRSSIVTIKTDFTLEEVLETVSSTAHSRYPVISDDRLQECGLLLAKDLIPVLRNMNQGGIFELGKITRPAMVVPESKKVNFLLKDFKKKRYHLALVIDEFGSLSGLVTIEDILECIVGKIGNEYSAAAEENIREVASNIYHVRGITPIAEFNEFFHCEMVNDEVETIAGIVMSAVGHIPENGTRLTLEGFEFKVLNAESRRINMFQVRRINRDGAQTAASGNEAQ